MCRTVHAQAKEKKGAEICWGGVHFDAHHAPGHLGCQALTRMNASTLKPARACQTGTQCHLSDFNVCQVPIVSAAWLSLKQWLSGSVQPALPQPETNLPLIMLSLSHRIQCLGAIQSHLQILIPTIPHIIILMLLSQELI